MKITFFSLVTIFALSSCNTMVGVGRDTRILGESLERTAADKASGNSEYDSSASGAPVY